jgi:hypothetical protein
MILLALLLSFAQKHGAPAGLWPAAVRVTPSLVAAAQRRVPRASERSEEAVLAEPLESSTVRREAAVPSVSLPR